MKTAADSILSFIIIAIILYREISASEFGLGIESGGF